MSEDGNKKDIRSMEAGEIADLAVALGGDGYRGTQVFRWIHQKYADGFDKMRNVPKDLRAKLGDACVFSEMRLIETLAQNSDQTTKCLFHIGNNNIIESVYMRYSYGVTACISSQCGCRMGCVFCASGMDGFARNLTAGEMCAQVYMLRQAAAQQINGVVIMGCGEPLDNYDNLLRFIKLITDEDGFNLGARNITVSTCGLIPEIYRLAEERLQITLAVSLHTHDDALRGELMPVARKYPVGELLQACSYYSEVTKRRITYEYAVIPGLNDSPEAAGELGRALRGTLCHVNLIPLNPVAGMPGFIKDAEGRQSAGNATESLLKVFNGYGIETTVRRTLGKEICAACGQLRRRSNAGGMEDQHG